MKEWLSRNYSKERETIEIRHEPLPVTREKVIYEIQPVEFRVIPTPVVHHEIVYHQPVYEEVFIHHKTELAKPEATESPKKVEEKQPE